MPGPERNVSIEVRERAEGQPLFAERVVAYTAQQCPVAVSAGQAQERVVQGVEWHGPVARLVTVPLLPLDAAEKHLHNGMRGAPAGKLQKRDDLVSEVVDPLDHRGRNVAPPHRGHHHRERVVLPKRQSERAHFVMVSHP